MTNPPNGRFHSSSEATSASTRKRWRSASDAAGGGARVRLAPRRAPPLLAGSRARAGDEGPGAWSEVDELGDRDLAGRIDPEGGAVAAVVAEQHQPAALERPAVDRAARGQGGLDVEVVAHDPRQRDV